MSCARARIAADLRGQPRVGVAVQVGPELVICARLVAEDEAGARVAASALGELLRRVETLGRANGPANASCWPGASASPVERRYGGCPTGTRQCRYESPDWP